MKAATKPFATPDFMTGGNRCTVRRFIFVSTVDIHHHFLIPKKIVMKLYFLCASLLTVALLGIGCNGNDTPPVTSSTDQSAPPSTRSGDKAASSTNRPLEKFTSVDLQTGCRITLRKGNSFEAALEGPAALLQILELVTKPDGQLVVRSLEKDDSNFDQVTVTLYTPGPVSGLAISGSGQLTVQDSFDGIEALSVSGSGTMKAEATLRTRSITAAIAGSGNIEFFNLQADELDGSIAGSGNIYISVANKIDANIAGSGSLFYKGDPTVDKNVTGSGQVSKQ
jgi:hypothetical protein